MYVAFTKKDIEKFLEDLSKTQLVTADSEVVDILLEMYTEGFHRGYDFATIQNNRATQLKKDMALTNQPK